MALARLLDPLRNPLLERDVARLAARPAAFRVRTLAAAVSGLVLLLVALAMRGDVGEDLIGRAMHGTLVSCAVVFLLLQSASEAALAIPGERATGSLTVLLTAPLSAGSLARGFLLSRVLSALYTFLAVLPLEGAALLFGGVGTADLLWGLFLGLYAAVLGTGIGLLAGSGANTHRVALARVAGLFVVLVAGIPTACMVVAALADRHDNKVLEEACERLAAGAFAGGPIGAVVRGGFGVDFLAFAVQGAVGPWAYLALAGGTAAVAGLAGYLAAARRFALESEVEAGNRGAWKERLGAFLDRRTGAATRRRAGPGVHPLLWRESRSPAAASTRWAGRAIHALVFGGMAWLLLDPRYDAPPPPHSWATDVLLCIPVWGLAVVLAGTGTLLAEERERSALDILRATPIDPREMALARAAALVWRLRWIVAASAAACAVAAGLGRIHPLSFPAALLGATAAGLFLSALAARLGATSPTVRGAATRSGIFLAVTTVGLLLACILFAVLTREEEVFHLMAASPFVAMVGPFLVLVQSTETTPFAGDDGTFAALCAVAALAFGAVGFGLWSRMGGVTEAALRAREDAARS